MRAGHSIEKWTMIWFVTLCTSCIVIILTTTLFILHREIIIKDQEPPLQHFIPQLPQQNSWEIPIVDVKIIINDIPVRSIAQGETTINATISFQYDPEMVSSNTIDKFSFDHGTIEEKEPPRFSLSNKLITADYRIRAKFTNPLNFEQFPLDDHRMYLALTNNTISSNQIIYRTNPTNITINKNAQVQGWSITNTTAKSGIFKVGKLTHPAVLFSLDFQNQSVGNLFTIVIPLIILLFIALITLIPTEKNIFSLNFSAGNIAALLAYRFIIQNTSPAVGYLTMADTLYSFVLITSILCLIFNLFGIIALTKKLFFAYTLLAILFTAGLSITFILIVHQALFGGF